MAKNPSRTRELLFWLPVSFMIVVLFGLTIFSGRTLFWGLPITQFVPWWLQAKMSILEGGLPLWNPNLGMGAPLLANYQLAFFYPPNWLYLAAGWLGDAPGIAWLQAVLVAMHLLWAALGMRSLARALGLAPIGQVVAALSFSFSGYLVARAWFLSITLAVTWIPWVMWAGYQLAIEIRRVKLEQLNWWRDFDHRRLVALILVWAMQLLAGHAQITWYSSLLLCIWMLFWIWRGASQGDSSEVARSSANWKQVGVLFLMVVVILGFASLLAAGLAGVQLIPTGEYLLQSQRAGEVEYEAAMTYSFWPWRFLGFLAPNLFGNPAFGNYWGYANFWEDAVYIGLVPFLLAMGAVVTPLHSARRMSGLKWILVAVTVIAFMLALGQNLPIFPWLYQYIPTFDMFNAPTRWSILAVFALSLLAGIGASGWFRPQNRALYWTRLGTAGGGAITLGAMAGWLALQQNADLERLQTMAFAIALAGIWALGGGVLSLTAPVVNNQHLTEVGNRSLRWHIAAVLWIALDLTVAGLGLNPAEDLDLYSDNPRLYTQVSEGRVYMPPDLEQEIKFDHYFSFSTFHAVDDWTLIRSTYLPNIGILNGGAASVNNFDPMVPDRYATWLATLDHADPRQLTALLNLSGVSTVVNKDPSAPLGTRLDNISTGEYIRVFVCQRFYNSPEELLISMLQDPELLESVVFLEGSGSDTFRDCGSDPALEVTLLNSTSVEKNIQVSTDQPVWLMLAESWYPGWQATIDDQPAEIRRADYVFQAVRVPAGENQVRFEYSPRSLKIGFVVSFLSIIMLTLFLISKRFILKK